MIPQLIDTHCHLYLDIFDPDIPQVIQRAENEGITKFYLPAIDRSEEKSLFALEKKFPGKCLAMMGLHPCSIKENYQDELNWAENWLQKRRFSGVGETGLDYYWDKTFIKEQAIAFRKQIEWALHYDLPVIIHSRNSLQDCIDIIRENQNGKLKGIFHCFSEGYEFAKQIMDLGFYMGIGGVLTYKNSGLAAVVEQIPMDWIVLETDSPYLTPVPFRGKRNESSYLKYVVAKLAEVKKMEALEIGSITTANAQKIFGV